MKLLRQQFNQLCADLGIDRDAFFMTDSLDRKLTRIIKLCARAEYRSDEKHEANFNVPEDIYVEAFNRAVEIHASIMLARMSEVVTGAKVEQSFKPILSFTSQVKRNPKEAKDSWDLYVNNLWSALQEVIEFAGPEQTIESLNEGIDIYETEIASKSTYLYDLLKRISDSQDLLDQIQANLFRLKRIIGDLAAERIDDNVKHAYDVFVSNMYKVTTRFSENKLSARKALKKIAEYKEQLLLIMPQERAEQIVSQVTQEIEMLDMNRDEYRTWKTTRDKQLEMQKSGKPVESELPATAVHSIVDELSEDDLYANFLPKMHAFFVAHADVLNAVQLAETQLQLQEVALFLSNKDKLEGLCQVLRLLNLNTVEELFDLGKDQISSRLQKVFFQRELNRTLNVRTAFSASDFQLDGDEIKFMQSLLPTIVYQALISVSDIDVSVGEFAEQLGSRSYQADLQKMQLQVAKILEWDFFVHHAEYSAYVLDYVRAHGVPENIRELWQTSVLPELMAKKPHSSSEAIELVEDQLIDVIGEGTSEELSKSKDTAFFDRSSESMSRSTPFTVSPRATPALEEFAPLPAEPPAAPSARAPINVEQPKPTRFRLSISYWLANMPQLNLRIRPKAKPKSKTANNESNQSGPRSPSI